MIKRMILASKILGFILVAVFCGFQPFAAGVANSPMRGWTPKQYVKDMLVGWNLGNTMDASGGETGWGNL